MDEVNAGENSDEVIFVEDYNSQEVDGETEDGEPADGTETEEIATGIKCDNALDYIAEMRISREVSRSEATEECMAIIEDSTSSDSEITSAQEAVTSISTMTEIEDSLESAIKGRGYEDVFVIYDDDGSIDITVIAKNMTDSEVNTIAELVHSESGVTSEYMSVCSVY